MKSAATAAILAIGILGATVFAPALRAQQDQQGALTKDSLKAMLDGLGLEPKPLNGGYVVTIKRDGWDDAIQFGISDDRTKLGLNANLGAIAKPDTITAAQWKKLLEDNFEINPSFISFDGKNNRLFMARVLDNHAITPAYLRQQIDNFCTNVHTTAADWQLK